MEHSIIAACVSLLLGCSIQDNSQYTHIVRENLPNSSFDPLVEVLQKLRDFAYLAVRKSIYKYETNILYQLYFND